MARVVTRGNGLREVRFKDTGGKRRTIYLGRDFTKKECERFAKHIDHIVNSQILKTEISSDVARFVADLPEKHHKKLVDFGLAQARLAPEASKKLTLGSWTEKYIVESPVKESTKKQLRSAAETLCTFFGSDHALETITISDAANYRIWMENKGNQRSTEAKGLALNTVRKKMSRAKQFFKHAVEQDLIASNPFRKELSTVGANEDRMHFIEASVVETVIRKTECEDFKIMLAFARYAGMRSHETRIQRWDHIDLVNKRMTVRSYKNHKVGDDLVLRECPIFPELLPHLVRAREMAPEGSEKVVTRYTADSNVHTQAMRYIKNAGFEPWEKPWNNLRASRATELKASFSDVDVHKWMGHTEAVARKHYLMPLESSFQEATVKRTTLAVGGGDQNPHQNPHHTLTHQHSQEMPPRGESVKNTEKEWQSVLLTLCDFLEVTPTGLEPVLPP